ncbi:hypothetical protein NECID01_1240 [Nematocida sp. AWRm77]|nr:hypothetical protein NECID01_1240 [Nematocida sp. AWRm77]
MRVFEQLQRIRQQTTTTREKHSLLTPYFEEDDVLFYERVQKSVEVFEREHSEAYAQHRKLFEVFTSERTQVFRRHRLTEKENARVSRNAKRFLAVLSVYGREESAQNIVDWMIRKYRVDRHEFQSLLVFTLSSQARFEHLAERAGTHAIEKREELNSILQRGYSKGSVAAVLCQSTELSACVLDTLKEVTGGDAAAYAYMQHYAEVIQEMGRHSTIPEEVLSLWINDLFDIRHRLKAQRNQASARMRKLVEASLCVFAAQADLVESVMQKIRSFREKEHPARPGQEESGHVVESSFNALYQYYRRTGEHAELLEKYLVEFVEHASAEALSTKLPNITTDEFLLLVVKSAQEDRKKVVHVLGGHADLLQALAGSAVWSKLQGIAPEVGVLKSLVVDGSVDEVCGKGELFASLLPSREVERKLFEVLGGRVEPTRQILPWIIARLSADVLAEQVQKARAWEYASLFVQESTYFFAAQHIDPGLLASSFEEYLGCTEGYAGYAKVGHRLSPQQKEAAVCVVQKRLEERRGKHGVESVALFCALIEDLEMSTACAESLLQEVQGFATQEKKQGLKSVLSVLSVRSGSVDGAGLVRAGCALETKCVDKALSVLFFETLVSLTVTDEKSLGVFFTELGGERSVPRKMVELVKGDRQALLKQFFLKYAECIPEEGVFRVKELVEEIGASLIVQRFEGFSAEHREKAVAMAIREKEAGQTLLFSALFAAIPLSVLLLSGALSGEYGMGVALDAVVSQRLKVGMGVLNILVSARRAHLPESSLKAWEEYVLSSPETPDLLSQKLAGRKDLSVARTLAKRYLKTGLPSSILLQALVEHGVRDCAVLSVCLEQSPSSSEKVQILKLLIDRPSVHALRIILRILKNKRSLKIRGFVQAHLMQIARTVLQYGKDNGSKEGCVSVVMRIASNLLEREGNVLSPCVSELIGLARETKKNRMVRSLCLLDARYVLAGVTSERTDMQILRKYVEMCPDVRKIKDEEKQAILAHHIKHIAPGPMAVSLAQLFGIIEDHREIWSLLLAKTNGFSHEFLSVLLSMVKNDTKKTCTVSLGTLYSKLEDLLLSELSVPTDKASEVIYIMIKFYQADQGTLVRHKEIADLVIKKLVQESRPSLLLLQCVSLLAALFFSRTHTKLPEADEINILLLKTAVKEPYKKYLFKVLEKIYKQNNLFVGRALGQSAPYFAILLESKDASTRAQAQALMRTIEESTGESPYTYME